LAQQESQGSRVVAADITKTAPDEDLSNRIRASFLLAGPLLARFGTADMPLPGGDVIGRRRLDTHIHAFNGLGAEIEVPTLEDKAKIKIPAGAQTGTVFRLKGKGIADLQGYGRGDELVRVHVEVPRKLTPRQRELLEEYARNGGEEVSPLNKGFLDRVREMFG